MKKSNKKELKNHIRNEECNICQNEKLDIKTSINNCSSNDIDNNHLNI